MFPQIGALSTLEQRRMTETGSKQSSWTVPSSTKVPAYRPTFCAHLRWCHWCGVGQRLWSGSSHHRWHHVAELRVDSLQETEQQMQWFEWYQGSRRHNYRRGPSTSGVFSVRIQLTRGNNEQTLYKQSILIQRGSDAVLREFGAHFIDIQQSLPISRYWIESKWLNLLEGVVKDFGQVERSFEWVLTGDRHYQQAHHNQLTDWKPALNNQWTRQI